MAEFGTQRRIEIDVARYEAMLESVDLTVVQKEEVVRAVWTIVMVAIDLGLGIHPVGYGRKA